MMNKNFLDKIKISNPDNSYTIPLIWGNEEYYGIFLKNYKKLEFHRLYPNLILKFMKNGMIRPKVTQEEIEIFESALQNNNKIFINSFYGRSYGKNNIISLINQHQYNMFKYLTEINKGIIYIDVDMFFYTGDLNMPDIDIDYSIKDIDYLYINHKKSYFYYSEDKLYTVGSKSLTNKIRQMKIDFILDDSTF